MSDRPTLAARTRILLALHLGVGPLVGLLTGSAMVAISLSIPSDLVGTAGFWILLGIGMASGFLPSSFAAISAGVRGGLPEFPLYLAVMAVAAFVPWWILRRGPRGPLRIELTRHKSAAQFLELVDRSPFLLLLGIRLAPFAVFSWTNALFALSPIRAGSFLVGTVLGAAPRALAMFAAGAGARSLSDALHRGENPTFRAAILASGVVGLLIVAAVVGRTVLARLRKRPGKLEGAGES